MEIVLLKNVSCGTLKWRFDLVLYGFDGVSVIEKNQWRHVCMINEKKSEGTFLRLYSCLGAIHKLGGRIFNPTAPFVDNITYLRLML